MNFNLDVSHLTIGIVLVLGGVFSIAVFLQINRIENMLSQIISGQATVNAILVDDAKKGT